MEICSDRIIKGFMADIDADSISKHYRIYPKPSDRLKEVLFRRSYHKAFPALTSVSFHVDSGETFGIIGDNGAGKSTLLKILSGTLQPSEGQLVIHGRVAALLELGAGFHPEFSGRQNIYLNATLLGLSHEEIQSIEKDIIEFAELEEFIDRPVKTYSSGMYIRLAFSIATTVDPDILIIDEALSVGDQHFQKKCVNRMMGFRSMGKTIIFCSHSMYFVTELCDRAMWLNSGKVREIGYTDHVVMAYEKWCREKASSEPEVHDHLLSPVKADQVQIFNAAGYAVNEAETGEDIFVRAVISSTETVVCHLGIGFENLSGEGLFGISTKGDGYAPIEVNGTKEISVAFPGLGLINGAYKAFVFVLDEYAVHVYDRKLSKELQIRKKPDVYGCFYMDHYWELGQ